MTKSIVQIVGIKYPKGLLMNDDWIEDDDLCVYTEKRKVLRDFGEEEFRRRFPVGQIAPSLVNSEVLQDFYEYKVIGYAGDGFGDNWCCDMEFDLTEGGGETSVVNFLEHIHKDFTPLYGKTTLDAWGIPNEVHIYRPTLWAGSWSTSYDGETDVDYEYEGIIDMRTVHAK